MSLLLSSPTLPVEVRSSDGHATLHVHRSVLEAIPFFSAQLARWAKNSDGPLKVELPEPVAVASLSAVLEQTYSSLMSAPPKEVQEALRTVQVASMLNVQVATIDACTRALRGFLRSEEDISLLRDFASAHQVGEITSLAKRFKTSSEIIEFDALRKLYIEAVRSHDEEMMQAARHHLKIRSRQGPSALEEAAAILASDVFSARDRRQRSTNTHGMDIVFKFVEAHPLFFAKLVESNFNDRRITVESEYVRFMNLGAMHCSEGKLPVDALASVFKRLVVIADPPIPLATHFAVALGQLDSGAHLAICKEMVDVADAIFIRVVDAQVMKAVAMEAKDMLAAKGASLPDCFLRQWLNKPAVLLLSKPRAAQLLCRAGHLEPDAKTALLNMCRSPAADESDDGF